MHALVIGGGIAGPTAAMALQKAGITSVVYEARPADSDDRGAFLSLFANGIDALAAIGADRPVIERSFDACRIEFATSAGKQLGAARLDRDVHGDVPGPRVLTRADLCEALHGEAVRRGIRMERGRRLGSAVRTPAGRVVAAFQDGTVADGDLLIGCDGIHSVVRRIIDEGAPEPRYTGEAVVCGYARKTPVAAPPQTFRMIYGKRAFFAYVVTPGGDTWWFTNVSAAQPGKNEPSAATRAPWKKYALERVQEDKGPAADLVHATGEEDIIGIRVHDIASTPTWHSGPMVVVGDAAHAASPNAGHGAAMALEDGVTLAMCLRDLPDIPRAFERYEQLRRGRVERLVATSARMRKRAIPAPLQRLLRDIMLPRLLKDGPRNAAPWLTRHHIDWRENLTAR
ncbi:FAD-dependent oxidoreductase [Streptomyces sp. NBC_00079]|uniref:FAD-dependent oxidoreductase n=1 Tax=Streptomyces sp. NBC_00079 TaxID=2975644 RepID=UPI003250A2E7